MDVHIRSEGFHIYCLYIDARALDYKVMICEEVRTLRILVIGTGYVGTTTIMAFAEMGWKITGLDTDTRKVSMLRKGVLHFYEHGLEDMLVKHLKTGNITFTSDSEQAIKAHDIIFICVGTPSNPDGSADLSYLKKVANEIGHSMNGYKLVINKSTVPVGTLEKVARWIQSSQIEPQTFDVASNPEFLREGNALVDALHPDRIIIGTQSDKAAIQLRELYQSMGCPVMLTTPRTAELIKYASNAFLATKISYINELSRLCDQLGVSIIDVAQGMGLDSRIGHSFLQAGIGFGGSCFPKDVTALIHTAEDLDSDLSILEKVMSVNQSQTMYVLNKARKQLSGFRHRRIALLGLTFKPDTDDMRQSPSLRILDKLLKEQAYVTVHDPVAKLTLDSRRNWKQCKIPEQALQRADAVILCTAWPLYSELDWSRMKHIMNKPNIIDGRNMLDAKLMRSLGFHYQGVGYE